MQTILEEVQGERLRQDLRFGAQPRSLKPALCLAVLVKKLGEVARSIIEGDSDNYRVELIQLAVVAVVTVEDFDLGNSTHQIELVPG